MTSQRTIDELLHEAKTDPALFAALAEMQAGRLAALARHYNEVIDRITDEILARNESHE